MGRAGRVFPLLPARTCVSPRPVPGVQNPFPRPDVSVSPFTDTECTWNCFFPEEKILFPNLGGWNLCLPSPRAPRADAAAWGKREGGSFFRKPGTSGTFSHTCVVKWHLQGAADATARCSPVGAGEGEARTRARVPRTAPAGDQGQNASTEKVERLKDNRGGSSVVIYNRDCKVAN